LGPFLFHSILKPSVALRIPQLHGELLGRETLALISNQAYESPAIGLPFRKRASKIKGRGK
jgi:hypothetical protein